MQRIGITITLVLLLLGTLSLATITTRTGEGALISTYQRSAGDGSEEEDGVILVATGPSGVFTSLDGENWTKRSVQGWVPWNPRTISSNGQEYVILGDWSGGGLINSLDGINWVSSQLTGSSVHDVIWANGMYVAVGEWGREAIRWSSDGITWNHRSLHSGPDLHGVAWGNGRFVAVGKSGSGGAYWSTNGTDWYSVTTSGNDFRSVAYGGNGYFVKVGDGRIQYSTNGVLWTNTHQSSSTSRDLNKIIWNGSLFVAVGPSGRILISPTGTTEASWSQVSSGTSIGLRDVTWSSALGAFFAVGNDVVLKSTDGSNWEVLETKDTETGEILSMNLNAIYGGMPPVPQPGTGYYGGVFIDTGPSFQFSGNTIGGANATMIARGSLITPQFNGGAHTGVSNIFIEGSLSMNHGSASFGSQSAPGSIHIHGDLSFWSGTRNVYGDVYVDGSFELKDARLHGVVYVNGDLTLGWTPQLDSNWHIYYTGTLTHPANYSQQVLARCTQVASVPLPQPIPYGKPQLKPHAWYVSNGYITSGTTFNQNAFTSNTKFFVNSFSTSGWIPSRENVVIVSQGDITIGNMGGQNLSGILFAPNGKITIQNLSRFDGIIIANEVLITTGGSTINYKNIEDLFGSPDDYPF